MTLHLTMTEVGQIAYEAYCESTGGVSAVSGAPLPEWDDQSPEIQRAWVRAAAAVIDAVS